MTNSPNKGGRPKYEPTDKDRNIVRMLTGFGIEQVHICQALGIKSEKTLRRHFRKEIAAGAAQVEAQLVGSLLAIATSKKQDGAALKAIMFALQSRFGWSMYAPAPVPREPELGKKETQAMEARTGHVDTGWGDLLH